VRPKFERKYSMYIWICFCSYCTRSHFTCCVEWTWLCIAPSQSGISQPS